MRIGGRATVAVGEDVWTGEVVAYGPNYIGSGFLLILWPDSEPTTARTFYLSHPDVRVIRPAD